MRLTNLVVTQGEWRNAAPWRFSPVAGPNVTFPIASIPLPVGPATTDTFQIYNIRVNATLATTSQVVRDRVISYAAAAGAEHRD